MPPQGMAPGPPEMSQPGAQPKMTDTTQGQVWHVPKELIPEGMKVQRGDILEFKALGPADADGDVPVEYNHEGYGEKEGEQTDEGYADDFHKFAQDMSPASDARPEAPGSNPYGGY